MDDTGKYRFVYTYIGGMLSIMTVDIQSKTLYCTKMVSGIDVLVFCSPVKIILTFIKIGPGIVEKTRVPMRLQKAL